MMTSSLSFRNIAWLIAALALAAAPHAPRLPLWVMLLCGALAAWRLHIASRSLRLIPKWILLLLTAAAAVGIYLSFGTIFGRNAGVALLILLIPLKLMEMRSLRDAILVIFLGYFVILTNFLYSQTIVTGLFMLLVLLLITATLVGLNNVSGQLRLAEKLRLAGIMLAQSIPLMLVLFIFFPRVQGPLWGLPQDAYTGITGLSDTMSPGSISQLGQSDAVAFRVNFATPIPKAPQLYWRGPVLWHFDGRTWSRGERVHFKTPELQSLGEPARYTVTLEPHNKKWLFALDLPSLRPDKSVISSDFQLIADDPVKNRVRYDMISRLNSQTGLGETSLELQRALQLPQGFNPRALALAQSWKNLDKSAIIREALTMFRNEKFYYTLNPPLLDVHTVDEFLFNTRRGFCEHYASSFAFLMRAAGIPARVVTGYQGGEINPLGNYLIVRQAEAHAWVEVWLENQGWVRIDPTAAVSPLRVESGIAAALPRTDPLPILVRGDYEWLRRVGFTWDSLANTWNQWVLGYNPERQVQFLSRVGMQAPSWKSMTVALFVGAGVLLLAFSFFMLRRLKPVSRDPAQTAYLKFCGKMSKKGMPRGISEGPSDYAKRLVRLRPDLAQAVAAISDLYIALRYGSMQEKEALLRLKKLVGEFTA